MKVDYDAIARHYDSYRKGGGPYLRKLVELAAVRRASHVLEIGAGTGLNTCAFLEAYACSLTALEVSSGMIQTAKSKAVPAQWVQASALDIPLADASAQFIFGVYVLHHLHDLDRLFGECARVLGSGCAAFVTASHAFIDRHPMNRYFPSFARIDKARFQPLDAIKDALQRAGFTHTGAEVFVDRPRPIGHEYVERVANRFISTYTLMPQDEFEQGLAQLRADVGKAGQLDVEMEWESVAVWGEIRRGTSVLL